MSYLWGWFAQLHRSRSRTDSGPCPITFADIDAWSRVNGITLQPRETVLIGKLDETYFEVRNA